MPWVITKAQVWKSSCDYIWERDEDILIVIVDTMSNVMHVTIAYPSDGETVRQRMQVPRDYLTEQAELSELFHQVVKYGSFEMLTA